MSYSIVDTVDNEVIYGDGKRSCIGIDVVFQRWLRDNRDNLPSDIQAKVDSGELTIQEAD
tara:strand:+ start:1203 stop:1382 length:180 start_codon:yes stop_codon:yes gene_type:complete